MPALTLKYSIVDAFTSKAFQGNPAAVITFSSPTEVPPDATLQSIAAEFNLSETAFVASKHQDKQTATFTLRWFTPTLEVPLCGHATLASARVLFSSPEYRDLEELRFETVYSGVLTARKVDGTSRLEIELPETPMTPVSAVEVKKFATVCSEAFGAPVVVKDVQDAGFYALVRVDQSLELENAVVNADSFRNIPNFKSIIITSERPTALLPGTAFISRVFAPNCGIAEDPVTGSAHCVLAPYWEKVLNITEGSTVLARQVSRRGGDIALVWDRRTKTVKIQGDALIVARGELFA